MTAPPGTTSPPPSPQAPNRPDSATAPTHPSPTSTNLSNQPMKRLLARLGWRSVGVVCGLDEGDPELFFLAPTGEPAED